MERIYYELKDESSQYDDIQFTEGEEVEARYIKLPGIDSGNMYIEALPPPRNKTDIDFDFNKSIRKYSPEEIKNMEFIPSFQKNKYESQLQAIYEELKKIGRTSDLKKLYRK